MTDRSTPPPVHMMGDLRLPTPESISLPNGANILYIDGGSQDVVQIDIIWPGGACEAPVPAVGRLMAMTMREGTRDLCGAEISEALDFHGVMLKTGTGAHHTILTINSLNSMVADIMPVLEQIILHPVFPAEVVERFREMEANNIALAKSRVLTLANEAIIPLIQGPDGPASHIETPQEAMEVRREQLVDFHSRVVGSRDCTVLVSGKVTPQVLDAVTSLVGKFPDKPAVKPDIVPFAPMPPQRVDVVKPGAQQAAIIMAIPAPDRRHPDYVPLRFTVYALGGYFGARLMKNIREDKGYTYGISSYLLGSPEGSIIEIFAQADKAYIDLLISEVGNEMMRLASEPMPDDELTRLRQNLGLTLMEALDSPFAIAEYYKSMKILSLPDGYFDRQVKLVHDLSPHTIREMAARYLRPELVRTAVCS